jgi:hypothetical protein
VPGGVLAGPWVRDGLWRRARAVPSLDLRFADNKSLVDAVTGASLVTFTRASDGMFVDSAGVIQTAATDVPRFDHNPTTGESLGLLVEEQRTNSITNNTGVGAVAGTPGTNPTGWFLTASANGISPTIVGTGVEDGIAYVDIQYSGTSTGAGGVSILASLVTAITAATGQSWTGSAYVKVQAGSLVNLTNVLTSVNGRSAIGAGLESVNLNYTPTSSRLGIQRQAVSITLANALTARISHTIFNAAYASGVAIDITLRIGLPQLEQGAFATSPILTSTAAVTRSADVASITGSNFSSWFNASENTMFAEGSSVGTQFPTFAEISDGTSANRLHYAYITSTLGGFIARSGGSTVAEIYPSVSTANRKAAFAASVNNFAVSFNGAVPALDTNGAMPISPSRMEIGNILNAGATNNLNGTIRRLTFWGQRLANSTLQSITQ